MWIFSTTDSWIFFSDWHWRSSILDQCIRDQDPGQRAEPLQAQGQPELHPEWGVGHHRPAGQPAGQWQGHWWEDWQPTGKEIT